MNEITKQDSIFKPNLVIGGSYKCGTTFLHAMISSNENVFSPYVKEQNYFIDSVYDNDNLQSSINILKKIRKDYKFNAYKKYYIETSPCYLYIDKNLIPKLVDFYPSKTKFIFIVRKPSERIKSYFKYAISKNKIDDDYTSFISKVLRSKSEGNLKYGDIYSNCIKESSYSQYLLNWKKFFGQNFQDSVLIISFDELANNPDDVSKKIANFLSLDHAGFSKIDDKYKNSSKNIRSKSLHYAYLKFARMLNVYFSRVPTIKYFLKKIYSFLNEKKINPLELNINGLDELDNNELKKLHDMQIEVEW